MTTETSSPTRTSSAISVNRLRTNPWNKPRPLDAAFVASVVSQGILSPLLVREIDGDADGKDMEIICGERRYKAALEAGLEYVPAVTRQMDDQEAQLCTLIENTHREDMTPWQEAQLIGDLLDRPDWDIETAAAATGWSESMIRRRAKLLELSRSWKAMMEAGELSAWTTLHFEILAVFDEKRQEDLFKDLRIRANGLTVSDLKEEIADRSRALKSAPWDLDDVTLAPKAGACTGCSKRSDAQADLFGLVAEMVKAGASCLDEGCFKKKASAFTQRKADKILEKHPEAVKVAAGYVTGPKGALRSHEVTEAKKSDKGAVPALVYGDAGKVSLAYVKLKKSAQDKDASPKAQAKQAEEKRLKRIEALAIEKLITLVDDPESEFTEEAYAVLLQYCLIMRVGPDMEEEDELKRIRAFAKKPVTVEELWEAAAQRMKSTLGRAKNSLEYNWNREDIEEEAGLIAWMVDADMAALRKEAEAELAAGPAEEGGTTPAEEFHEDLEDGHDPEEMDDE